MTKSYATLGAGCFWGVEKSFRKKYGASIQNIRVGYAGGSKESTSYREVCNGDTFHAEVVHFEFDPSQTSYEHILDFFFRMHDPTTLNRQGGDAGTQYRSAIFYHSDEQKASAEKVIARVQPAFGSNKVSTTLEPFSKFWDGEEYHQDYLAKNPHGYECATHFERTWEKIASTFQGTPPSNL
ncbi:peptide methionine sulfoxide reductase MsrA [Chytriomyces cf. hyalinus JEL632]|nr:peptide methionine sulfoxide reductase MsrA [Chytriomyces cf. hyalinus JEL632]